MLKITYTAQLASLLLVVGWFAFSAITAEAVADTAPGQQASLVGSNAQEREADDIKCVRQMPRYRPAPDFIFKC
jgi:hypothetical protein